MTRVILRDSGWKSQILDLMKGHTITVGIHEKDTAREDGLSNAEVGYLHEYGTGVPQRSFLRSAFDESEDKIKRMMGRAFAKIARGTLAADSLLDMIGAYMAGRVVSKINSNISPALAESTVRAKGSSTALIDSGDLKQSIDYEVK